MAVLEIITSAKVSTLKIYSPTYGIFDVLIDTEDLEKVKDINWNVELDSKGKKFYVRNRKKNLRLHRVITNCPPNLVVDHINHNTLDNRKSNLRICTTKENNQNTNLENEFPNKTTGIYGISLWNCKNKKSNKTYCYYKVQYKKFKIKVFKELEDAKKYLEECRKEFLKENYVCRF